MSTPDPTRIADRHESRHKTGAGALAALDTGVKAAMLGVLTRFRRGFEGFNYEVDSLYATVSGGKLILGANLEDSNWEWEQRQLDRDDRSSAPPPKMASRVSKVIGVRVGVSPVSGKKGWWWFRAEGPSFGIVDG